MCIQSLPGTRPIVPDTCRIGMRTLRHRFLKNSRVFGREKPFRRFAAPCWGTWLVKLECLTEIETGCERSFFPALFVVVSWRNGLKNSKQWIYFFHKLPSLKVCVSAMQANLNIQFVFEPMPNGILNVQFKKKMLNICPTNLRLIPACKKVSISRSGGQWSWKLTSGTNHSSKKYIP